MSGEKTFWACQLGIFLVCLKKKKKTFLSCFRISHLWGFYFLNTRIKCNLLSEDVGFDPSIVSSLVFVSVPVWHLSLLFLCTGTPSPLFPFILTPTLIFLVQRKLVIQIFERKLSAGYLYAAPRQKSRFKETAICKHEGSRCCTIKCNLKGRGKVTEGQNESKVKRFFCCRYKYKNVPLRTFKSQRKHRLSSGSPAPTATSPLTDVEIPELCYWSCTEQRIHPLHLPSSSLFARRTPCSWAAKTPGKHNAMGPHHHVQRWKQNGVNRAAIYHPVNLFAPLSKNTSTISHVPREDNVWGACGDAGVQRFVLVPDPKSSGSSPDFVSSLHF